MSGVANVTLRAVVGSDRDFLRALYSSTRESEMAIVPWTPEEKARFLEMQFEAQSHHYDEVFPDAERSIVQHRGEPVGRLYIDHRPEEIRIIDIALLPTVRGRGIGGGLLRDVLGEAERKGVTVRIHVEANNPARSLYDRLGFVHVDTNGVYHLMEWRPDLTR